MKFRKLALIAAVIATVGICPQLASATVLDELVDGDFSGDPNNPTLFTLMPGLNSLSGTTISGDFDIVHVSTATALESIVLSSYASSDNLGFIGVQSGTVWTEGLGGAINPANLLGWSHFGPGNGTVGTDILDDLGMAPGSMGFLPPLPGGDYTFLIQQTGGAPIDYTFQFNTAAAPEPSTVLLLGCRIRGRARTETNDPLTLTR